MPLETPYRYLNVAGAWPGAVVDGLAADGDGRLRLPPGPGALEPFAALEIDPAGGFVGLAAAPDGTVYVADPGGGRVLRIDPCDHRATVLGGLDAGSGDEYAPKHPRGLAVGPPDRLYVADPDGGRVLAVDRTTGAVRAVWDAFEEPTGVAVDGDGRVVVADPGAAALRRFDRDGEEDRLFAAAVAPLLVTPRAVTAMPGGPLVLVDGGPPGPRVFAVADDGSLDVELTAVLGPLRAAGLLTTAAAGGVVWAVGDTGATAVTGGVAVTAAAGDAAGVAAHPDGRVLLATPGGVMVLEQAVAQHGTIVVPAPAGLLPWDRVRVVLAEPRPAAAHLRVWTRAGEPPPPVFPVGGDEPEAPFPTAAGTWRAAPLDVLDVRLALAEAQALWIAVELHGDGAATPVVDDIRVERTAPGWTEELPRALVGAEPEALERVLALVASIYDDTADEVDELPRRLDPAVTPDRSAEPWLASLARWVDVELAARLAEPARRELVADAMAVHDRRGTVQGIVDAVRRDVGVEVRIAEPATPTAWALGQEGAGGLAFGSALAAAPAGPPVLGTTAIVDRSWLIDPDERGLPLLGGTAHRFCVVAPAAALRDARVRAEIERVVEREKPAHTGFDLRALAPSTVVGAQARVGIDAVVGQSDRVGITGFTGESDPERTARGHE